MKLRSEYFDKILKGVKKYELRLNDKKRQKVKIGDFIEFTNESNLEESIQLKVTSLSYYSSFKELLNFSNNILENIMGDFETSISEFLYILEEIYPTEKQKKYGVLLIGLHEEIFMSPSVIDKYNDYYEKRNHILNTLMSEFKKEFINQLSSAATIGAVDEIFNTASWKLIKKVDERIDYLSDEQISALYKEEDLLENLVNNFANLSEPDAWDWDTRDIDIWQMALINTAR